MTLSDACKVVSYLSQKVEKEQRLNPASEANVVQTSQILHNYGFKKIKGTQGGRSHGVSLYTPCPKINDIVPEESDTLDLFTICGDVKLFKNSDMAHRYFNWFQNVSKEEFDSIYKKIGKPQEKSL